jgi:hypothetical protein
MIFFQRKGFKSIDLSNIQIISNQKDNKHAKDFFSPTFMFINYMI